MTKFIFKNAMALVALAIAGTTLMSFGLSKNSATELYWFSVSPDGSTITSYIDELPNDANPLDCAPNGSNFCAMGFDDSDLKNPGTPPSSPSDLKDAVQGAPSSHANETRHKSN